MLVGRRRLDCTAELCRPDRVTVAPVDRVHRPGFITEEDTVSDHERRGLGARAQGLLPHRMAVLRVEAEDLARDQIDDVEAVMRVGRRRGVELRDATLPENLAGVGVEREHVTVVVDCVKRAVDVDGREFEQRLAAVGPKLFVWRLDPLGRQVAGALRVVSVKGPVHRRALRLLLLGLEGRVRVVHVRGSPQRLVRGVGADRERDHNNRGPDRDRHPVPPYEGEQSRAAAGDALAGASPTV